MVSDLGFKHDTALANAVWESQVKTATSAYELRKAFFSSNPRQDFSDYLQDAAQRAVLFTETLYKRGNNALERAEEGLKPVLAFDYDVVIEGRSLPRPVNYTLVRIRQPAGYPIPREDGRPWVIIDLRAGHGSGIGGLQIGL